MDIIFGPLECAEAAEVARDGVINVVAEHGSYWEPSEVPNKHWNEIGRVLKFLRNLASREDMTFATENPRVSGDPLKCLAETLAGSKPWAQPAHDYEPHHAEIPF